MNDTDAVLSYVGAAILALSALGFRLAGTYEALPTGLADAGVVFMLIAALFTGLSAKR